MSALQAHQLMSIGDALSILKNEFEDVTISKLRYLETEGLVEPQRTNSGYRKYSHADVQRLRFVLTQQRDQYLPLRVIKEQLDALDRGLEPSADSGSLKPPRSLVSVDSLPQASAFRADSSLKLTSSELLATAKADIELLAVCQQYALISNEKDMFSADDVAVLTTVVALAGYGIEPRHLRAFKMAADREVGLVEQVVAPLSKQKDPDLAQQAPDVARDIAALSVSLHVALVRSGLGEALSNLN